MWSAVVVFVVCVANKLNLAVKILVWHFFPEFESKTSSVAEI